MLIQTVLNLSVFELFLRREHQKKVKGMGGGVHRGAQGKRKYRKKRCVCVFVYMNMEVYLAVVGKIYLKAVKKKVTEILYRIKPLAPAF